MQPPLINIIYGSETSICTFYANVIHRSLSINGVLSHIMYGNKVLPHLEKTDYLIIISSNTKEGAPPTNIEKFYDHIRLKSISPSQLPKNVCVFGMGNSTYEKHNRVGIVMSKRFSDLGVNSFHGPVFLDKRNYEHCCYGFMDEVKELTIKLEKVLKIEGEYLEDSFVPLKELNIEKYEGEENLKKYKNKKDKNDNLQKEIQKTVKIFENIRTTASDHYQDVRILKLKSNLEFDLGDTVAFYVPNKDEEVLKLCEYLEVHPDSKIDFSTLRKPSSLIPSDDSDFSRENPETNSIIENFCGIIKEQRKIDLLSLDSKITVFEYLKYFVEIRQTVSFIALQYLKKYAKKDLEKEKLELLSSREGTKDFYYYIFTEKRPILEVLRDFRSVKITLSDLVEFTAPLRERQFSIVNTHDYLNNENENENEKEKEKEKEKEIEILVAMIDFETPYKIRRRGLLSENILEGVLSYEAKIMKTGLSALSKKIMKSSLVSVCTGTGISATMCFLRKKLEEKGSLEGNVLIYGFRSVKKDFHYEQEIKEMGNKGLKVLLAVSRDGDKKYVQDVIEENSELLWDYMENKKANFLICGKAGMMPRGVRKALKQVIKTKVEDDVKVIEYYADLEKKSRVIEETWA